MSAAGLIQQGFEALRDVGHQFVGADTDLLIDVGHRQDLAGQVADTQLGAASADRGRQHNAGVGVEDQPRGWPAAGGRRFGVLEQQAACLQRRDPSRDCGARQSGHTAHVGAGANRTITNQAEHLARGCRCRQGP